MIAPLPPGSTRRTNIPLYIDRSADDDTAMRARFAPFGDDANLAPASPACHPDERVEAVARAICEADLDVDREAWPWEETSPDARADYRRMAKAALAAAATTGRGDDGAVQRVHDRFTDDAIADEVVRRGVPGSAIDRAVLRAAVAGGQECTCPDPEMAARSGHVSMCETRRAT